MILWSYHVQQARGLRRPGSSTGALTILWSYHVQQARGLRSLQQG